MTHSPASALCRSLRDDGHDFVYLRAGITASYYMTAPMQTLGSAMAEVIRQYIRFAGEGALTHFAAENGTFKPLTTKRLQRDLALLEALPRQADLSWEYQSVGDGGVGDHRIRIFAADADEDFPELAALVRLEFPDDAVQRYGLDRLVQFIAAVAGTLRPQSANAGWGFKRAEPFAEEAREDANALLPRYLGFDPGFDLMALTMRGHSAPAHWINFVDDELFRKCGGMEALARTESGARVEELRGLVMIRASRLPPIGDANLNAPDLGCMPGVARFLKPVRVALAGLGDDRFDVEAWLSRFDELQSQSWDN